MMWAATGAVWDGQNGRPEPRRTRHVYFGLEVIQEYSCGAGWPCETSMPLVREFLHGDPARYPEQVAMIRHNPDTQDQWTYHYLHDVLGSVIGVVNETGTLVERYTLDAGERLCRSPRAGRTRSIRRRVKGTTYDPYGKVFIEKWDDAANEGSGAWVERASECGTGVPACGQMPYSPTGNPFLWTGHRYDAAVGLYHTHFRFYDPVLGRWLQRDPIGYAAGSINLYEYVLSGPLFFIDPLGLSFWADVGDFLSGVGKGVVDTARGVKDAVADTASALYDDPKGTVCRAADRVVQATDQVITDAQSRYSEARDAGYSVGASLIGAGGATAGELIGVGGIRDGADAVARGDYAAAGEAYTEGTIRIGATVVGASQTARMARGALAGAGARCPKTPHGPPKVETPATCPKHGGTPEGRQLTKHYETEEGPKRKIHGSVVDNTINTTKGVPVEGGKTVYYDHVNNVTVVTGNGGAIVSAHKGPPRKGQY